MKSISEELRNHEAQIAARDKVHRPEQIQLDPKSVRLGEEFRLPKPEIDARPAIKTIKVNGSGNLVVIFKRSPVKSFSMPNPIEITGNFTPTGAPREVTLETRGASGKFRAMPDTEEGSSTLQFERWMDAGDLDKQPNARTEDQGKIDQISFKVVDVNAELRGNERP